jgi:[ribosomal protein S5]-alanine N-acetyltransferase
MVKRRVAQNREMRLVEGNLELRPWQAEDLGAVAHAAQDPYIREIEHIDDAAEWLERAREGSALAIVVDGDVVGGIALGSWQPRRGSLGYFVLERARGRGVATRAVTLLVRWALTDAEYVRVQATVEPWNVASIRVLEKSGLQREGLLRSHVIYGDRVGDAYMYAAVRGDF